MTALDVFNTFLYLLLEMMSVISSTGTEKGKKKKKKTFKEVVVVRSSSVFFLLPFVSRKGKKKSARQGGGGGAEWAVGTTDEKGRTELFRSKVGDKCLMSPSAYSQARRTLCCAV